MNATSMTRPQSFHVYLVPAADEDLATFKKEREELHKSLVSEGAISRGMILDRLQAQTGGEPEGLNLVGFIVTSAGTALVTALVAWIKAKAGRKVRLKFGDTEAEAQTVKEIKELVKIAREGTKEKEP